MRAPHREAADAVRERGSRALVAIIGSRHEGVEERGAGRIVERDRPAMGAGRGSAGGRKQASGGADPDSSCRRPSTNLSSLNRLVQGIPLLGFGSVLLPDPRKSDKNYIFSHSTLTYTFFTSVGSRCHAEPEAFTGEEEDANT